MFLRYITITMSNLKTTDKKILEKLFKMEGGYVLSFSDRTFGQFFKDECGIDVYDEKNGYDYLGTSKANRMRAVWAKEDDKTVGSIIVTLVEYAKTDLLTDGKEITSSEKELLEKAGLIGMNLLLSEFSANFRPEVQALKNKAQIIKDFNACDFQSKTTNEKIYILKVIYSYYQGILEAYYGSGLFFLTSGIDDLNDYFKILRKRMMEVVDSDKTFSEIKATKAYAGIVESITSLYSATDFFDGVWEDFTLPSIVSLREEIADKDLFGNNSEIHTVSTAVSVFFQAVDKEIDVMKRYLDQKTKNFNEQELPKYREQFNNVFNSGKEQVHKIQIVGMPDLTIKNTEDDFVAKGNKKIHLPKFKPTDWAKITIRFINERDVLITADKKQIQSDYESLGFADEKKKKPNTAWAFLFALSKSNGETITLPKPIPDTIRQHKLSIAQKLKAIFKNETDPFYDSTETQTYKIKIQLIPPQTDEEKDDKYGTQEYLKDTMTEEYEQ